jgi:tetratricopeptide (TPR) repeat protein
MKGHSKAMRTLRGVVVLAAAGMLLTGCGPPGKRELRRGEELVQAGQFAQAIGPLKDVTQVLTTAPRASQAKAWNLLGLAYHGAGKLDEASRAYGQALKLDRDNAAVDYNLGCLRMDQSNYVAAVEYLTTFAALRPKDYNGYLKLGEAGYHLALTRTGAERSRQMESAKRDLDAADKLHPTAEAANLLGLIDLQRRASGTEPIKAAQADFELALRRDPQYPPALLNLAILLQKYLKQPRQALDKYHDYLALQPPPPHTNEVEKLARQLDLDIRITITPGQGERPAAPPARNSAAPTNIGPVKTKVAPVENPVAQAAAPARLRAPALEEAPSAPAAPPRASPPAPPPTPPPKEAQLPPPPSAAPAVLPAESSASVNTAKPDNALTMVETVPPPEAVPRKTLGQKLNPLRWFGGKPKTAADGSDAEPAPVPKGERYNYPLPVTPIPGNRTQSERLTAQATQDRQQGRLAEALRGYQAAIEVDPTYFPARLALGLAAIDARDYPRALEALDRALELRENSADARYAFAWTLQKRGYYEDAAKELERLLATHPQEVRACLLLGNLYAEKLGRPKSAREQYARVLELDPQNPQAGTIRAWIGKAP